MPPLLYRNTAARGPGSRGLISAEAITERDLTKIYSHLEAHDSSTIHAGDVYTNHYGNNNITTTGSIVVVDRDVLESSPANIVNLVQQLQSATLLLEELQSAVRGLEDSHHVPVSRRGLTRNQSRLTTSLIGQHRVSKSRSPGKDGSRHSRLPTGATLRTSISYIHPANHDGSSKTFFTMKVRFTISYEPTTMHRPANRWYEWEVQVVDPSHRRLLASPSNGIGIVNLGEENEFFPSCEVLITLEKGWAWDDDELNSELVAHCTRAEVFECEYGRRTIDKEFRIRCCSCFPWCQDD